MASQLNSISRFNKPRPPQIQTDSELDWSHLNGESYKTLPALLKTHHGQRVDAEAFEAHRYVQYTKEELETDHLITVQEEGFLCLGIAKKVITALGEGLIFVMHRTGKIYATAPIPGSIFHSSLCIAGEPDYENPIAPGTLSIKDGIPMRMKENSGHYAPKNCLPYVMAKLFADGCKWVVSCQAVLSPFPKVPAEQRASPDIRKAKLDAILAAKQFKDLAPSSATERKSSSQDETPLTTPSPIPRERLRQASDSPSLQARRISEITLSGKLSRNPRLARLQTQLIQEAFTPKTNSDN